jgi:acyl carrier protein phosphodiesterase
MRPNFRLLIGHDILNYLAHLYLAREHDALLLGGFLGDFVKGRLTGQRPSKIEAGIQLHRNIDAFTDTHSITLASRNRFPSSTRRMAGIAVDIIYDHLLAKNWHHYSEMGLEGFEENCFRRLLQPKFLDHFPERALRTCQGMASARALSMTKRDDYISRCMKSLANRIKKGDLLLDSARIFEAQRDAFSADFEIFFGALIKFTNEAISNQTPVINRGSHALK